LTLPSPGINYDIGVFGTGSLSAGWDFGFSNQYGFVIGDASNISGITRDISISTSIASLTLMFDQNGFVGATVGPAAEVGASASLSETHAAGLNQFGNWLGGWIYQQINPYVDNSPCH
jgi:hypothetical protein